MHHKILFLSFLFRFVWFAVLAAHWATHVIAERVQLSSFFWRCQRSINCEYAGTSETEAKEAKTQTPAPWHLRLHPHHTTPKTSHSRPGNWRRPPTGGGSCCRAAGLRDTKRSSTPGTSPGTTSSNLGFCQAVMLTQPSMTAGLSSGLETSS